jgi:predicted  nucleic acid-binding Zn-ribbon protein
MEEQIPLLARLSQADLECHRLRERGESIPREIERQEAELRAHTETLSLYEQRLEDSQRERRALERDSDQAKARRRELELHQFRVKNTVEYQALTREIEDMRRRSGDLEDSALKYLAEEEEVETEIRRLSELVAQEESRVAEIRNRLETELKEVNAALEEAERLREGLVGRLSPRVRNQYERILRSKGDMAVVAITGGACGGCYYQLPPQRLAEVRKRNALIVCEGCGRILVWTES